MESGEITESTQSAVLQLNEGIGEFGGKQNAGEWDVSALATSSNWRDLRERARLAPGLPERKAARRPRGGM